jgi:hypothetical protein
MTLLTKFVTSFEKFRREPEDSPADFERIFSVIHETHLFREVQDIRDELRMLDALFQDQITVLGLAEDKLRTPYQLGVIDTSIWDSRRHVENQREAILRMIILTDQAYNTVTEPA